MSFACVRPPPQAAKKQANRPQKKTKKAFYVLYRPVCHSEGQAAGKSCAPRCVPTAMRATRRGLD
jgi:hypothetical protein